MKQDKTKPAKSLALHRSEPTWMRSINSRYSQLSYPFKKQKASGRMRLTPFI